MNTRLSALFSKHLLDRRAGHRARVLAAFEEKCQLSRLNPVRRTDLQNQRLAEILVYAQEHVPFHREQAPRRETITPQNARSVLSLFPVVRRADIQRNPEAFVSDAPGPCVDDATGGSTGTPMMFRVDRNTQIARESSLLWANSLAGRIPGEKVAMLWGSVSDVQGATGQLRLAVRWWIENMRWYNAFDMGEDRMEAFHSSLSAFRPHLLVAYAGSAFTFARFLQARGSRPAYPLKAVVTSAEMCTPAMRSVIEDVFGRPVFDRYGNREFGAMAAECQAHEGLHINEADCIVEIDSADPFKVEGPILVTYLSNRAMPFIRYDTGDVGRFLSGEPCACGRLTARLAPVMGRQSDTIRTASGKLIHGEYFTHLLYGTNAVREFQFVQETPTLYRLLLVADPAQVASMQPRWRLEIGDALGAGSELRIEYVDRIPALPSGKRRFTLTKVGNSSASQKYP